MTSAVNNRKKKKTEIIIWQRLIEAGKQVAPPYRSGIVVLSVSLLG